jgi:hypothetical protein
LLKYAFLITCSLIMGALAVEYKHYYTQSIPVPVATLADGAIYEGELRKGLLSGSGRLVWPNKEYYEGDFEEGLFHGEGLLHTRAYIYEGDFAEGRMSGEGILRYQQGDLYKGEVFEGLPHGNGVFTHEDAVYTGAFDMGEYHGKGELIANGSRYNGGFNKGRFDGKGTFNLVVEGNDEVIETYSGQFVGGQLTGAGQWKKGEASYEGEFVDYQFDGKGIYRDGDAVYEGEFTAGNYHGEGVYDDGEGESYTGDFLSGLYHGKGVLVDNSGDVYSGELSDGQKHGQGQLDYAQALDGITLVKGMWERGKLISADDPRLAVSPEVIAEHGLYHQSALLQSALDAVVQENSETIDLYFVGIGGDGTQGVFRREVGAVKQWFDEYYITGDRSVALINNRFEYDKHPFATLMSIEKTLQSVSSKMDEENDILFVYLSSHGSSDFRFNLAQPGFSLASLPAEKLGEMLAKLPVRHKVVVISACYSGGFVKEIKDDYMMVITAASADRASFGCSDRSTMTYFGEAFFKDALFNKNAPAVSFAAAFDRAREIVEGREAQQGLENSKPLIYKPKAILAKLKQWREQQNDQQQKKPNQVLDPTDKSVASE